MRKLGSVWHILRPVSHRTHSASGLVNGALGGGGAEWAQSAFLREQGRNIADLSFSPPGFSCSDRLSLIKPSCLCRRCKITCRSDYLHTASALEF